MGKLHELLAVEGDLSGQANRVLTETLGILGKGDDFVTGVARRYKPKLEGEEQLPPETKEMRTTVPERLAFTLAAFGKLIDAAVSKETTNTTAAADLVLNGQTLAKGLPAQALLNLEARFKTLRELLEKIPTLDATVRWEPVATLKHVYLAPTETKIRTKKVEDYRVVVQATKEHPAQVVKVVTDQPVGEWETTTFSGAVSAVTKNRWLERCDALLMAVKQARQRANMAEIVQKGVAEELFNSIFGVDLK